MSIYNNVDIFSDDAKKAFKDKKYDGEILTCWAPKGYIFLPILLSVLITLSVSLYSMNKSFDTQNNKANIDLSECGSIPK